MRYFIRNSSLSRVKKKVACPKCNKTNAACTVKGNQPFPFLFRTHMGISEINNNSSL